MVLPENGRTVSLFVKSLSFYFVCLIFGVMNIGAVGSALKLLAALPMTIMLYERGATIRWARVNNYFLLFVLMCSLSFFWSLNRSATASRIVTQLLFVLLLYAATSYEYSDAELQYMKGALILSSRLSLAAVLLFSVLSEGRIVLEGTINEDPNYLCGYFAFGIVHAMAVLLSRAPFRKTVVSVVELAGYLYVVVGSGSRGGTLAIAASILAVFFWGGSRTQLVFTKTWKKVLLVLLFCAALVFVTGYVSQDALDRFSMEDILSTGGTGRLTIWEDTLTLFLDSSLWRKLVGYGTGAARTIVKAFSFRRDHIMHNIHLENLVEIGLIGALFYLGHTLTYLRAAWRQQDKFAFASMCCMVVLALSTSLSAYKPYWNIVLFTLCCTQREADSL